MCSSDLGRSSRPCYRPTQSEPWPLTPHKRPVARWASVHRRSRRLFSLIVSNQPPLASRGLIIYVIIGLWDTGKNHLLLTWLGHGIRNIYYFMIPCCCISFFATLFFVKGHSLKRDDDAKLLEEGKQWAATHKAGVLMGTKKPAAKADA